MVWAWVGSLSEKAGQGGRGGGAAVAANGTAARAGCYQSDREPEAVITWMDGWLIGLLEHGVRQGAGSRASGPIIAPPRLHAARLPAARSGTTAARHCQLAAPQ